MSCVVAARFEPGQVWRTKGGELWCVTDVDLESGKVSHLILFSLVKSVVGRPSWHFPDRMAPSAGLHFRKLERVL